MRNHALSSLPLLLFCCCLSCMLHTAHRLYAPPYFSSQAHFILDEMLSNGIIVESNKSHVLAPINLLEKAT